MKSVLGYTLYVAFCGRDYVCVKCMDKGVIKERAKGEGLLARGANTEEARLLGGLIILLVASCFPTLWTAGQLNCLWINSLVSYRLHRVSEVHLNPRNPIILAKDGKHSTTGPQQVVSLCCCSI